MSTTHQLYCTHCTFGSSAIERRQGEMSTRPLGYNVRAASIAGDELRRRFREIERFLYYYLPPDAPAEQKLVLDAATAPRRLTYFPTVGDLQVLGQMSYRQKDTAERPGCYFGHFVYTARNDQPWSVLDTFRLWGAPWRDEDSPELPFDLPPLASLADVLAGKPPSIHDALLEQFLRLPAGATWNDPAGVVTDRWRKKSEGERRELLFDVLSGYLGLANPQRDSVLLAIEPSVAALVFFGVARLLPAGPMREQISYSTYEPAPERLPVALAATTFFDEDRGDLRADLYRGRNLVLNTFTAKRGGPSRLPGVYARMVVEALAGGGYSAVDALLDQFAAVEPRRPEELEALAQAGGLLDQLFDAATRPEQIVMPTVQVARTFIEMEVRRLAAVPSVVATLAALGRAAVKVPLLQLVAGDPANAALAPACHALLKDLSADELAQVLAADGIAPEYKVEAIVRHVTRSGRLPDPCPSLWQEPASGAGGLGGMRGPAAVPARPLLPSVLATLDPERLNAVSQCLTPARRAAFEQTLLAVASTVPSALQGVRSMLERLDDNAWCAFFAQHEAALKRLFAQRDLVISERFAHLLEDLPKAEALWATHVAFMDKWRSHLPDPHLTEARLGRWQKLLKAAQNLSSANAEASALWGGRGSGQSVDARAQEVADAFTNAMTSTGALAEMSTGERVARLRQFVSHANGQTSRWSDAIGDKIGHYFDSRVWPLDALPEAAPRLPQISPARSRDSGSRPYSTVQPRRRNSLLAPIVTIVVLGAVVATAANFLGSSAGPSKVTPPAPLGAVAVETPHVAEVKVVRPAELEQKPKELEPPKTDAPVAEGGKDERQPKVAKHVLDPEFVSQLTKMCKSYHELTEQVVELRAPWDEWEEAAGEAEKSLDAAYKDLDSGTLRNIDAYSAFKDKVAALKTPPPAVGEKIDEQLKTLRDHRGTNPLAAAAKKPLLVLRDEKPQSAAELEQCYGQLRAYLPTGPSCEEARARAEARLGGLKGVAGKLTEQFLTPTPVTLKIGGDEKPFFLGPRVLLPENLVDIRGHGALFDKALVRPCFVFHQKKGGEFREMWIVRKRGSANNDGTQTEEVQVAAFERGSQEGQDCLVPVSISRDSDVSLAQLQMTVIEIVSDKESRFFGLYGPVPSGRVEFSRGGGNEKGDGKTKAKSKAPSVERPKAEFADLGGGGGLGLRVAGGAIYCTPDRSFPFTPNAADAQALLTTKGVACDLPGAADILGTAGASLHIRRTAESERSVDGVLPALRLTLEYPKPPEDKELADLNSKYSVASNKQFVFVQILAPEKNWTVYRDRAKEFADVTGARMTIPNDPSDKNAEQAALDLKREGKAVVDAWKARIDVLTGKQGDKNRVYMQKIQAGLTSFLAVSVHLYYELPLGDGRPHRMTYLKSLGSAQATAAAASQRSAAVPAEPMTAPRSSNASSLPQK